MPAPVAFGGVRARGFFCEGEAQVWDSIEPIEQNDQLILNILLLIYSAVDAGFSGMNTAPLS
jgi:hypothetical protein